MNPIAFTLFGIGIRWYGILIASGMLIGILIAKYTCKIKNVNYDYLMNTVLIALPLAILGARLYYVLFEFSYYKDHINQILNTRQGGLAIHGGVIFAFISSYIYIKYKRLNFLEMADVAVPSIILAQSIGRWGNFMNQEAHGGEVSYNFISHFPAFIQNGMYIHGIYYNPTFLYESIWNFCIFVILIMLLKKTKKTGLTFFSYIGLYSVGRFFIEGLRTDSLMLGPLRIAQIVSLTGVILWLITLKFYFFKKSSV